MGPVEHIGQGVLNAGELRTRHGMPSHKGNSVRQYPGPLQNGPLYPAHIGHHGARPEMVPVLGHKFYDALGMEA